MRQVALRNGTRVPALGLGTFKMGEDVRTRAQEVRAPFRAWVPPSGRGIMTGPQRQPRHRRVVLPP